MHINISYDQEFYDLIMYLKAKYPKRLFDLSGIGRQLDLSEISKDFFTNRTSMSDVSVDPNSNVDDTSVISYDREVSKPIFLLNSYYVLWKKMRQLYGIERSNKVIEKQLTGSLYINDFTGFATLPYSYYPKTVLVIKINEDIIYTTMDYLFDKFKNEIIKLEDRETINLNSYNIFILENDNKWIKLNHILRHKSHTDLIKFETKNGFTTIVTEDHPVILENGKEIEAKNITINDSLKMSNSDIPLSFEKNINEKYAYMIGFYIGDGFLFARYNKKCNKNIVNEQDIIGYCGITFAQNNIKESKIYKIVKELYPNYILNTGKENRKFTLGNDKLARSLLDIGVLSHNKKLPEDILKWNKKSLYSLISGLIDSDGSVCKSSGTVNIRTSSFALIQQIGEILRSLGEERIRVALINPYKKNKTSYNTKHDMYRVSFVIKNIDNFNMCDKIMKNKNIVIRKRQKDGRWETSKLNKIQRMSYNEYVYDITTETGIFHSQGLIQHNCYNYSTYDVALQGLPMIKKIKSIQPKHLYAFKSQMEQFITIAANSTLGATGISDLFITMSAYVKRILNTLSDAGFSFKDEKSVWKYVKENIVSFIYTINQPMRAATQSPFTNVSIFDDFFLDRLVPDYKWYVGEEEYKSDKEITKKIQELFLDIMNEELRRTPVTFPVTTACFSLDDDKNIKDKEFLNMISEKNLEFGFINIYVGKTSTLSSCCRLRSDVEKAQLYTNNFGAGSTKIGSQNVTTINLPRIAFKNKNDINKFFVELEELAYDAQDINNAKRHILRKRIDSGNHPLYTLGFINLNSQFSTIGLNGFYECLEILGYDIMTKEGQEFGIKILNLLNSINDKLEKKYSAPHNLEQIPAENVSIKLAEKDKLLKYNEKYDFYSNQFIPLIHKANLLDRIHLQGIFDDHFSGGAICHLNVEQKIDNPEIIKRLIESSAKQGVVYFAINFVLQLCENSHMNISNAKKCITCGSENLESYTRIVGYLTPVRSWNEKRRVLDFPNRQFYVNEDFKQVA